MTTQTTDECPDAFEKWASDNGILLYKSTTNGVVQYGNGCLFECWNASRTDLLDAIERELEAEVWVETDMVPMKDVLNIIRKHRGK